MHEYLALVENPKRRKRKKSVAEKAGKGLGGLIFLGGISYLVLCAINKANTGRWSWTPWRKKVVPVARRIEQSSDYNPYGSIFKKGGGGIVYAGAEPTRPIVDKRGMDYGTIFETWK